MAITITRLEDLPRDFPIPDNTGVEPVSSSVKLRLVSCNPKNDKRSYWANRGLVPVVKGSGLVKNEDLMAVSADGVLRIGECEVWAEHVDNNAKRARYLHQKAEDQASLKGNFEELESAGIQAGTHFSGRDGRPAVEIERPEVVTTTRKRNTPRREETVVDENLPTKASEAGSDVAAEFLASG
jgi:hypothetical protein